MQDAMHWSERLESLARPVLADIPLAPDAPLASKVAFAQAFSDESGRRRPTDMPLIAHLLGFDPPLPIASIATSKPDIRAWSALHHPIPESLSAFYSTTGPLAAALRDEGIEAWTEAELSALHALATIAIFHDDPRALDRCRSAVEWHLEELQPDNGTNRPWAVHAFAICADRLPDAAMHARTLVHNACVERGRPERLSALILMHSAKAIRRAATTGV